MKRALAAVVFLTALVVLVKVVTKPWSTRRSEASAQASEVVGAASVDSLADAAEGLRAKYAAEGALADRVLERYRRTALEVEASDGLRGLRLLDRLDLEAIYLYEKHPDEFRRLAASLSDDAAADLLLHWKEYFGLKRADDVDRERLVAEIARLPASKRRLAARYPAALPLLLAEPEEVARLIERWSDDPQQLQEQLLVLDVVSLEGGSESLRRALETLERHRELAVSAFGQMGPEGFALVRLYGPLLEALGDALPLDHALILLRVNTDDVDAMLASQAPETVAEQLRHVAAVGLVEEVGASPHGLRLAVEFGAAGDRALERAGGDAADVVYEYDESQLRQRAVEALGAHGSMAAAMLAKYASDEDFREILRRDGAAVIPPVARSDVAPDVLLMLQGKERKGFTENLAQQILAMSGENGQATIRMIRHDGLARVAEVNRTDVHFAQFLPLYDLLHLGGVVVRGHAPTGGEMAWALVDGCFVIADVLSLAAVQPGVAVASEAARGEVKATARAAARTVGREAVEQAAESAGGRVARWWAVRSAGGTFQVMKRLPEALGKMSVEEVAKIAGPMCGKAGLRLSTWSPLRFLKDGQAVAMRIPPRTWAKYVGINVVQAGVGVGAMHKMEEYSRSRRTN